MKLRTVACGRGRVIVLGKFLSSLSATSRHIFGAAAFISFNDVQPEFGAFVLLDPKISLVSPDQHVERDAGGLLVHQTRIAAVDPEGIGKSAGKSPPIDALPSGNLHHRMSMTPDQPDSDFSAAFAIL